MSSVPEIYCSDIDPGVRQVVGKLASLAMDTDTQDVMVKQDGLMNGLIGYLNLNDDEVNCLALKTIYYLAQKRKNRECLLERKGVREAVYKHLQSKNPKVIDVTKKTIAVLEEKNEPQTPANRKMLLYTYTFNNIRNPLLNDMVATNILPINGCVSVTIEKKKNAVIVGAYDDKNVKQIIDDAIEAIKLELNDQNPSSSRLTEPSNEGPEYLDDMGNNENENKNEQLDIYGYNEYESYIEEKRKERRERIKHDKKKKTLISYLADAVRSFW